MAGLYKRSFYRFDFRAMKWKDAKATCEAEGAHVVCFQTIEEYNALKPYFDDRYASYWTGGRQKRGDGITDVKWATGDKLAFDIWAKDEPNSEFDCIALGRDTSPASILLTDEHCGRTYPFICEINS